MPSDINQYKSRLSDYLDHKGITKKKDRYCCVSSQHEDNDPSATIYENAAGSMFNCNSCGFKGDIFDCAGELIGMKGRDHFQEQLKEIQSVFGGEPLPMKPQANKNKPLKPKLKPVALGRDEALETYNEKRILGLADFTINKVKVDEKLGILEKDDPDYREIKIQEKNAWFPYYDENELIDLMEIRFFFPDNGEKTVLSFWYNGKSVVTAGYPVVLYNRHLLVSSDKPVIVHEGVKFIGEAEKLMPEFTHTGWNGGGNKFLGPDWKYLEGKESFLLPDDDFKKHKKTKEILPPEQQPGLKTMIQLKTLLAGDHGIKSTIIPFFLKARDIKRDGADIEEILQCYSPDEITKTILELRNGEDNKRDEQGKQNAQRNQGPAGNGIQKPEENIQTNVGDSGDSSGNYPFKILGIADDGRAYFLDYTKRLVSYKTTEINANMLSDIGTYNYFKQTEFYGNHPTAKDWLDVIDTIRMDCKKVDFDVESIKGRGAWKDSEDNICYHDGKDTTGNYDPEWTFIRKNQIKIGIDKPFCDFSIRSEIMRLSKKLSFENPSDCIKLLSWAVLAPFSGALTFRPAFMLSADSGAGKSTIINKIVKKISLSLPVNGGTTSEAGIRHKCNNDSGSTIIEEAEPDGKKGEEMVSGQLTLMRASTDDDSPKTYKGSTTGAVTTYEMKQMFGFVCINSSVANVANDNRIVRITLKKKNNFTSYKKDIKIIKKILTIKNCNGIRSFTWKNLENIISLSERLEFVIQEVTGRDARYASGESILLAANMIVWEGMRGDEGEGDEENKFLTEYVREFYHGQAKEEKRDTTEEMIIKILDQTVIVGDDRKVYSYRYLLTQMKYFIEQREKIKIAKKTNVFRDEQNNPIPTETKLTYPVYRDYKRIVEHKGLSVYTVAKELAIVQNHQEIMKTLDVGEGYHHQQERHKNCIIKGQLTNIDGTTKRCTIISGFLEYLAEEE